MMHSIGARGIIRCSGKDCRKELSARVHTFFYRSALSSNQILWIGYLWLAIVRRESILLLTGHSPNTITSFISIFRKLEASTLTEENTIIGGKDIAVEIDESKLGKRKYHVGHRVDEVCVVVDVERTPERRLF